MNTKSRIFLEVNLLLFFLFFFLPGMFQLKLAPISFTHIFHYNLTFKNWIPKLCKSREFLIPQKYGHVSPWQPKMLLGMQKWPSNCSHFWYIANLRNKTLCQHGLVMYIMVSKLLLSPKNKTKLIYQ